MSSYYTTVSCEEWRRMQDLIKDADSYVIRNNREIERLRKLEQERRAELNRINNLNSRAIELAVDCLTLTGRVSAEGLIERIGHQIDEQTHGLSEQIDSVRQEAANADFRISHAADAIEQIARDYSEIINDVLGSERDDESRANTILTELDALIAQIRELNPQTHLPAEYSAIEANRAAVASNIRTGDYQSAIMVSQGSIINASRVLMRLIAISEHNNRVLSDAQGMLSELQGRIDAFSSEEGRIVVNTGEDTFESEYDIDYWSNGTFAEIAREVDQIAECLNNADNKPVTTEEIERHIRRITELNEFLSDCDLNARNELAGSIAVENTAQRLYDNLTGRGWNLSDSGHREDDSRRPYTMTLDDGTGNTVSVVIAAGNTPDRPAFFYEAFADNEGMASLVKDGIGSALVSEGLNPQNTVHRDDCHNNKEPEDFINNVSLEAEQMMLQRQNAPKRPIA